MLISLTRSLVLPSLLALSVSGCGSSDDPEPASEDEVAVRMPGEDPSVVPGVAPKNAGTEPPIPALEPIGDEPDVELGPTLGGCSFTHDDEVLFIAGAQDDVRSRGRGVIQIGGVDRLMTGTETGGPEMINAGPTMTDGEYTIVLRRAGGEGEPVGIESVRWPADLIVRKDMTTKKTYTPGTWTCGV